MRVLSTEEAILGYALGKLIRLRCPKCKGYSNQLKDRRRKKTCPHCGYIGSNTEWENYTNKK